MTSRTAATSAADGRADGDLVVDELIAGSGTACTNTVDLTSDGAIYRWK